MTMTPAQEALSDDAKAAGAAWFGMMSHVGRSSLIFHMVESRPSERAQAALDELVDAGIIAKSAYNQFGAVEYKPLVDCRPLGAWMMAHIDEIDRNFKLTEKIEGGSAPATPRV